MNKKILAKNRRAGSKYDVIDTYEAGIKLDGSEVKSVKSGHIKIDMAYVSHRGNIMRLLGAHISPYKPATSELVGYDPGRSRDLLLNKKEISGLIGKLKEKRLTLVPLSVYNKSGIIKIELGLVRGKKQHEKREMIKKRDIEREIGRKLKS